MDLAGLWERTHQTTAEVLEDAGADSLRVPSPYAGWTARDVADHLVGVHLIFARVVEGEHLAPEDFGTDEELLAFLGRTRPVDRSHPRRKRA